jgi:hypothetical protein
MPQEAKIRPIWSPFISLQRESGIPQNLKTPVKSVLEKQVKRSYPVKSSMKSIIQ